MHVGGSAWLEQKAAAALGYAGCPCAGSSCRAWCELSCLGTLGLRSCPVVPIVLGTPEKEQETAVLGKGSRVCELRWPHHVMGMATHSPATAQGPGTCSGPCVSPMITPLCYAMIVLRATASSRVLLRVQSWTWSEGTDLLWAISALP